MKKVDFNQNWLFRDEETARREWVTLPHDAMIHTKRNPNMPNYFLLAGFQGDRYVYTKTFYVPMDYQDKELILEFEAVYCMSTVYINGKKVYKKNYGFTAFQVPLKEHVVYGKDNTVEVIADVPKEGHGRWYTGGGIYRPVNLYLGEKDYIDMYGVKITTASIAPAKVIVETAVHGQGTIQIVIKKDGFDIAKKDVQVENGRAKAEFVIQDAELWSADSPNLYHAVVSLHKNGESIDQVEERFGIRTVGTDSNKGLLVNGIPTFLRGGCIHNDNGVIGVINNDATELHRAKKIKKSGFNAIRSAHHPMSRSLMKACDEVGLYVMDEAFDYWYRPKGQNPYGGCFMQDFEADTKAMVEDAYNHPCVLLYSIGNEIPEAGGVKGVRIGKEILEVIHRIDTTRLTTLCPSVHWLREYLEGVPYLTEDEDEWLAKSPENKELDWKHYVKIFMGAVANLPEDEKDEIYPPSYVEQDEEATKNLYPYLDVAGYNYYEDRYDVLHSLHPERVLLGTETRGERIVETMRFAKQNPYLIGDFIWTLEDHLGEANCCNIHYGHDELDPKTNLKKSKSYPWLVNYGGVIDLIGTIQPAIHRFEFAWDEEKHGLYLASQPPIHEGEKPELGSYRWTDTVDGWTYEGCEGERTWIDVYTDASFVEIYINKEKVGETEVKDYYGKVPCVYEPGEVMGIGYDAAGKELYRTTIRTANADTRLQAVPDKKILKADANDFCFIDISVTDSEGNLKLLPEQVVSIQVEGAGTLQGFGSAYHLNEETYNQTHHATYLGRLQAVIRSGDKSGKIEVTLLAEPDIETKIVLEVKEA